VPEIQLHDPVVSDRLTVVDLLSHRSGLPRHEMTWLGHPGRSRSELVRRLRFLPLSKDLRQAFQYCNLGYLAAGYAVEVLSGTPWEDCLRDRMLTPLGMSRSNLSVEEMSADPDHATAYSASSHPRKWTIRITMADKWRKSSYSASMGDCIEISSNGLNRIFVRDSKAPAGPHLRFSPDAWTAFLDACRGTTLQAKNRLR